MGLFIDSGMVHLLHGIILIDGEALDVMYMSVFILSRIILASRWAGLGHILKE